jgi:hypothetical protein
MRVSKWAKARGPDLVGKAFPMDRPIDNWFASPHGGRIYANGVFTLLGYGLPNCIDGQKK